MTKAQKECKIVYKYLSKENGELVTKTKTFKSYQELDAFLWNNKTAIFKNNESGGQVFYDLTPSGEALAKVDDLQKDALDKIEALQKDTSELLKKVKNNVGEGSAGLTSVYGYFGNPTDMNLPVQSSLDDENTSQKAKTKASRRKEFGNSIHNWFNKKVKGATPGHIGVNADGKFITSTEWETAAAAALKAVIDKHTVNGKAPTLRSEMDCMSKGVFPGFMKVLIDGQTVIEKTSDVGKLSLNSELNGRCDLIVIDANGDVFIYDWKTTQSEIDVSSMTNANNNMRLASYYAMYKQHGVNVKGCGFVNLITSWTDDGKPTKLTFDPETGIKMLPAGNRHMLAASTYFPSAMSATPLKALEGVNEIVGKCIPDSTLLQQRDVKLKTVDIMMERAVKITDSSNPKIRYWHPDANYYYYLPGAVIPSAIKDWVYSRYLVGKTKEELKERLQVYYDALAAMGPTIIPQYAEVIREGLRSRDLPTFRDALHDLAPYHFTTLYHHLSKYMTGEWTLVEKEELIQNGIFIFQKLNTKKIEIVALDTHILHADLNFLTSNGNKDPHRTSILGSFLHDKDIDPMFFLRGTTGNAILLKVLAYLSLNADAFGENSVAQIKALSTCDKHVAEASNGQLEFTWTRLCAEAAKKGYDWKLLPKGLLMDDLRVGAEESTDVMASAKDEMLRRLLHWKPFDTLRADGQYKIEDLEKRLQIIRTQYPGETPEKQSAENEIQRVMHALQQAILVYYGYFPATEKDLGLYLDNSLALEGGNAASMQESKSVILRQLQHIISSFYDVYKQKFETQVVPWQRAFDEFKKEVGLSYVAASDFKYFREHWFDMEDGKIQKTMRIKSEINSYWNTVGPKEKALYKMYIKLWEHMRYDNDEDKIAAAKANGSFYEIPLIRTNFKKQCEAGGLWDSVKGWWKRKRKELRGSLFDLEDDIFEEDQDQNIDKLKLPNYMLDLIDDKRIEAIDKNGTSYYETNMDIIYLTTLAVGLRREMSDHAMMLINCLRASTYYSQFVDNNTLTNLHEIIKRQINAKMFGRNVIDSHNKGVAMLVSFIKGITSFTSLAWNWTSFTRETIKGISDALARTAFDPMYSDKFTVSEYMDALKEIATSCNENIDNTSYIMQLSHYFGMANFAADQVVRASQTNPNGLWEFGTDAFFITATWPDFCHRTAFLLAHLKHLGALDAYKLDENGVISYDMRLDKRFQTYLEWKDKADQIPENSDIGEKFVKELTLYRAMLKDFERANKTKPDGSKYVEGDLLPEGLSPTMQNGLKVTADRLYGNYDNETKSLMQQELLGSLYFQFKTFPLSRLAQWFKSETHNNDIKLEQMIDKDGDDLAICIGEDNSVTLKKAKEIDPIDFLEGRAKLYQCPNGSPVEGHIQRMYSAGCYYINHDKQEFDFEWENNPNFRCQMAIAAYDTFFALILAFLVKMVLGEEVVQNIEEAPFITKEFHAITTGMTQDGPVLKTITGAFSTELPSYSIGRTYFTNAMGVIAGDANVIYAAANTFGATRALADIVKT